MSLAGFAGKFITFKKEYLIKGEKILNLRSESISTTNKEIISYSKCNPKSEYKVIFENFTVEYIINESDSFLIIPIIVKNKELVIMSSKISYSSKNSLFDSVGFLESDYVSSLGSAVLIGDNTYKITLARFDSNIYNLSFVLCRHSKNSYTIKDLRLDIILQNTQSSENTELGQLQKSLNEISEINNLAVNIVYQTDLFALNLNEMSCVITANKSYPNSYPKENIGECGDYLVPKGLIQTFYSESPNITKILKGCGDTLYTQTNDINSKYNTGFEDCDFFVKILEYSTLRYIFGGLSNNSVFSMKWLYSNNYGEFKSNMKNSDFKEYLVIFTEPKYGFNDFNKYYKKCKCVK